ncbi:MAG TPA: hypothetical protein VML55_06610 [Planctomycetaceae bacterium]|nr:hypothetical protein [Planctomycetaceae bacterium]
MTTRTRVMLAVLVLLAVVAYWIAQQLMPYAANSKVTVRWRGGAPPERISCRVVDADGSPLSDLRVGFYHGTGTRLGMTDANGYWAGRITRNTDSDNLRIVAIGLNYQRIIELRDPFWAPDAEREGFHFTIVVKPAGLAAIGRSKDVR